MSLAILVSDQPVLIQKWFQSKLKPNYLKLDSFDTAILEQKIYCLNLFSDHEQIVIYDSHVLNSATSYKKHQAMLEMMVQNGNEFYLVTESLTTKWDHPTIPVIYLDTITSKNKMEVIQQICHENQIAINPLGLELLNVYLPLDYGIIYHELQKLTYFHQVIDSQIVKQYICDYSNENTFGLYENLITGQTQNLIQIYENLMHQKTDVFLILNSLMSQACNGYYIKKCMYQKQNSKTIANNLNMNYYVVNKMVNVLYNLNIDKLKEIIHNLAHLDVKIKRNNLNKELFTKLWLINESRKYGK